MSRGSEISRTCLSRAGGRSTSICVPSDASPALRRAVAARQPSVGLIHRSDRGAQYASAEYAEALQRAGIVQSMSRKGNCNKGEGQSAPSKVRWLCPVPRGGEPVTEEFRASQNRADVTCTRRLRFPQTRAHGCYRLVAASEADAKYAATRETTPSARQRRYSVKFGENHHDDDVF